ncbi:MAG TPA: 5-formyltetrahydrofolate cyclo-ligase [Mycobacteriales bacterium]|nr:5-formyltetrahydrofolate cyclo-ligase [Mycobacteriales bacterium]
MPSKEELRQQALRRRSERSTAEIRSAGSAIAGRASAFAVRANRVAAFLSTPTEPPTRQLLAALLAAGCEVIVPVVVGTQMDWTRYTVGVDVRTSKLGVDEPKGERLGKTALTEADLVLVPALLVDRNGNRLGRGRGYYDRALAAVTARTVAIVYDDELVDELPTEPHDRRVSAVLRPAGLLDV